jgi:dipeptidyl aminopeptidase/acylaminoacyl peptidase
MSHPGQIFRAAGPEIRDVFDSQSDLAVMNVHTRSASASPRVNAPDRLETFPGWSADGKFLYYSSVNKRWSPAASPDPAQIAQTRFDLMRVAYDIRTDTWGTPEKILSADETGKSILEPRASPDGRYLLLCLTDYGGFPIHQTGADLYLLDLHHGQCRRLECNSDQADSWHCWSGNSRWIVFSSKRDNGLLARPYFCYIDAEGHEHKPFVLPQQDPAFYDSWLKTYNVPELVSGPVVISPSDLAAAIRAGQAGAGPASPDQTYTQSPQ